MKRGLTLGFLLLSIGAVAYLLLFQTADRVNRSGGSISERRLAERTRVENDADYATAPDDDGIDGKGRGRGRDNDPNRIAGPDVTIRGVVMRGDKPVPNAVAAIFRAYPRHHLTTYRWERRPASAGAPIQIKGTKCDAAGKFEITVPRRSELLIFADAPGAAFAWVTLLVPPKGNPEEITLQLGDAQTLAGRVVDTKQRPVAGVLVSATLNDWRTSQYRMQATTNEQGLFRFEKLRAGSYWIAAEPTNYPNQRRHTTVPQTKEVLFELVPGGAVVGRVTNSHGDAVANALLSFQTGDSWKGKTGVADTTTDSTGAYRIPHVLPGPLRSALLEHPDYGVRSSRQHDLILPTDLVEVGKELRYDIELPAGVTVHGIVVQQDTDRPVPGVDLKLLRMTKQYTSMVDIAIAKADGEGRFAFLHVQEGTYGIEAVGSFFARAVQRNANGRTPLTIDFFVDGKMPPDEQRVVVTATGVVRGKIEGVTPENFRNTGLNMTVDSVNRNVRVDAFGAFEFPGVPPTPETTVRSYNPQITSDPFEVQAGEVTEIVLKAKTQGGWAGVVKDAEGNPLAGAKVQAMAESQVKSQIRNFISGARGTRTDTQGRFLIPIQESARKNQGVEKWVIAAVHPDYTVALADPIKMPPEGQTAEVQLQLQEGGVVTGHVVVQNGGSPANIRVSAYPKRVKGKPFETRPYRNVTTDIDGSFELRGLGEGRYRLSAWSPGGTAKQQEVQAGDSGIRIEINPTESIAGVVVDEDGFPIKQGAVAALIPTAKGHRKHRGSVNEGRFRISNIAAGSYELQVSPQNQRYGSSGPRFEVKTVGPIATGTENIVITVSWGNTLEGRVLSTSGRALGGMTVVALPVTLNKKSRRSRRSNQRPMAMTNGRGAFTLKGLSLGEVELIASGPGYQPTTVRTAPGSGAITIHLKKGEVIEGKIVKPDGKPLVNQWFNLLPVSPELQKKMRDWQTRGGNHYYAGFGYNSMSGRTDGQGKFKINNLFRGQYKLNMRTDHGVAPDTTLQTASGPVTIQLQPALTITGVVLDPGGGPPVLKGRSRLYVGAYRLNKWLAGGQTDSDGNFTIKGLPSGNVTLRVWAGNKYKQYSMEITAGTQGIRAVLTAK